MIRELLSSASWKSAQFVDLEGARQLLTTFEKAKTPDLKTTYGLWTIATLEAWMRTISRYPTVNR
jgi:hypothetical protein